MQSEISETAFEMSRKYSHTTYIQHAEAEKCKLSVFKVQKSPYLHYIFHYYYNTCFNYVTYLSTVWKEHLKTLFY